MRRFISFIVLLAGMHCGGAMAQPLDDVRLEYQEQGVVATIRLTGPVQYLGHFPQSHGKTLEIYYDRAQIESGTLADKNVVVGEELPKKKDIAPEEIWVDNEMRRSPPSGLIPGFTVTSRDQQTKPKLVIEFSEEAEYSVAPGKDKRSLLITLIPEKRPVSTGPLPFLPTIKPAPTPVPVAALTPEQAAAVEINSQARALMVQGRDALSAKDNEAAVDAFNKLLLLPPNDYTRDAQEWVGVARERASQADKARIEYDLYLRLYPDGEGAARVAQRLAGLADKGGAAKSVTAETGTKKKAARWMTFGSISSRYYYGYSTIETTQTFNNAPETLITSLTDQSMLITSVDISERYVSEEYDGRFVFRDVDTRNFLENQPNRNRVSAAYGEIKNRAKDYMVRLGRQSPMGGGVWGRFDGLAGSYGFAPDTRLNGVAGVLEDYSQEDVRPEFAGVSLDLGPYSLYAIGQRVDGLTDRQAVGMEWRYFEGNKTVFALLDYDTYFRAVNAVQVMGTAGAFGGTVNFMADHRKSPSLSIRNALNGATTSSIGQLLKQPNTTENDLRELALARTATTDMVQLGLTVPVRAKWQVGGDIRVSETSGLPQSGHTIDPITSLPITQCTGNQTVDGCLEAQPDRGTEKSVTMQVIGSSLYKQGDIWSASVAFNASSAVKGYSAYLYNHTLYAGSWTLDTSLQYSSQEDQFGGTTLRTMPMLRGTYQLANQFYFDVDGGVELSEFSGAQQASKTTRYFTSAGLRLDF